jgi:hypothetical protein
MTRIKEVAFFWLLAGCAGHVFATGPLTWLGNFKFASEIVVTPLGGSTQESASGASRNRQKAQSAAHVGTAPIPVMIVTEEEDGVLTPAQMGAPADNRDKARSYSRETGAGHPAPLRIITDNAVDGSDSARDNLERNRNKARRYAEGVSGSNTKAGTYIKVGPSTGVVGADGVVVFACEDTNNIAGRIGDDTQSGNIFSVVINGKTIKARCK